MTGRTWQRIPARRSAVALAVAAAALLGCSACASSNHKSAGADYPKHPVTIIVPYAAGGGVDQTARALAPILKKNLGQDVVVSDIDGAGGVTGTTKAAQSKPDGYTLFFDSPGIVDAPWTVKGVTFGPKSFEYIGQVTFIPDYLVVAADSPFKTLDQLISYAKAHPGKLKAPFLAGWPSTDVMKVTFEHEAGIKFKTINGFTGGPDELQSVLAGRTDVSFNNTGEIRSDVEAGKVRILATSAPTRSKAFPKIPTFKEQGYNVEVGVWQGLAAPSGTPKPVLNTLSSALEKSVKDPDLRTAFKKIGITVDYLGTAATTKKINKQYKDDGKLFRQLDVAVK